MTSWSKGHQVSLWGPIQWRLANLAKTKNNHKWTVIIKFVSMGDKVGMDPTSHPISPSKQGGSG